MHPLLHRTQDQERVCPKFMQNLSKITHHLLPPENYWIHPWSSSIFIRKVIIDPTRAKDLNVTDLLLPSSALFSDSVGLRWSLILILPHPPCHPRKVSIKLHTLLNITYFYRQSMVVYSAKSPPPPPIEKQPKISRLWEMKPFPP